MNCRNRKSYSSMSTTTRTTIRLFRHGGSFLGVCSLLFYFFYVEVSSLEKVLLALIFVVVALYFVSKNKGLILRSFSAVKHLWEENVKRLGFSKVVAARPVQWFNGEPAEAERKATKIGRERVEFYCNGESLQGLRNSYGVYRFYMGSLGRPLVLP